MKTYARTMGIAFLLAAAWQSGNGVAQQTAPTRLAPAFTADQIGRAAAPGLADERWHLFNQRYSPLTNHIVRTSPS